MIQKGCNMSLILGRIDPKTLGVSGVGNLPHLLGALSGLIIFFEHPTWDVDILVTVNKEDR